MATRVLTWGLPCWAVLNAAAAAVWILGPFGTATIYPAHVPQWLNRLLFPLVGGAETGPFVAAELTDSSVSHQLASLSDRLTGYDGSAVYGAFGDIDIAWNVQFSILTRLQSAAWVGLHVAPLIVLGVLWWMLARVVTQARNNAVFTSGHARLLMLAGGVVMIGAPVLSILTWGFTVWVADSSEIASRIRILGYSWGRVPWSVVAAGFALVVLGQVWRRGAAMETELGGLV